MFEIAFEKIEFLSQKVIFGKILFLNFYQKYVLVILSFLDS